MQLQLNTHRCSTRWEKSESWISLSIMYIAYRCIQKNLITQLLFLNDFRFLSYLWSNCSSFKWCFASAAIYPTSLFFSFPLYQSLFILTSKAPPSSRTLFEVVLLVCMWERNPLFTLRAQISSPASGQTEVMVPLPSIEKRRGWASRAREKVEAVSAATMMPSWRFSRMLISLSWSIET